MNRKLFTITLITLLALLLSVGGATGQEPGPERRVEPLADDAQPQGAASIAATVNSRISYQGLLQEGSTLAEGSRDMIFRFYADDVCTTQVGGGIVKSGVQVTKGLFSVELDVAQDDFNGQGLWLQVEVEGTTIGCQEIMPAPYALSLRPGADVIGEEAGSAILTVQNSSGLNYSSAIRGHATSGHGETYGVYGQTNSSCTPPICSTQPPSGVFGYASAASGGNFGVRGLSDSTSGQGVYGQASAASGITRGVSGRSDSSTDGATGVYGYASAASGRTYGVGGRSDSTSGYGLYGSNSAGGYAGYFDGDVAQSRTGDGLVKAAIHFKCSELQGKVYNDFNNVADEITVSYTNGSCTIDFGFRVDDRFWAATATDNSGAFVRCSTSSINNDQLVCNHYTDTGAIFIGDIMVLIY